MMVTESRLPLYSRRSFLISGGIATVGAALLTQFGKDLLRQAPEVFIAGNDSPAGVSRISAFDWSGSKKFDIDVDMRCHGVAPDPLNPTRAVVYARRPGDLAYDIDFASGEVRKKLHAGKDRHFFGHGTFTPDGLYLLSSENDNKTGDGIVVVHDGRTLDYLSEFPSYGIGPHEIVYTPDLKTIVVANGGILTDPTQGREKLNIPTMQPSLAYIDPSTGKLTGKYQLENSKLSIRHLAMAPDGLVTIAIQSEEVSNNGAPLIAFHHGEDSISTAIADEETFKELKQYTGSVVLAPKYRIAAVTSSRGGQITLWDINTRTLLSKINATDVSGTSLSKDGNTFLFSTGLGEILFVDVKTGAIQKRVQAADTKWDNHLSVSL